ncbi:MAG: helix-turn-helix domain-containing protein [Oscillospiraceae bacterium]|nr:helix-turn-helix domain-containing protein [Oscillospiraceae bacterium]
MKITDVELNINSILDVKKGRIRPSSPKCSARHSDCFACVLTGSAEYILDGKTNIARPGDIIFLSHNSNYSIKVTDENYTFIFIDFFFENASNTVFTNEIYNLKNFSVLKSSFERIYHFFNTGNFSDKIYCKSIIYNIYSEIVKSYFSQYISHDRRKQIEQIATYIHENLSDSDLSIKKLSKMCNISEVHFRRIFSCIYHISPIKFVTLARINKAKELLLSETCSIAEVAEKCGFQNHYYFSKVFKSETNMTPRDFKRFYSSNL